MIEVLNVPLNPRIGLIGSVNSSLAMLEKLLEHEMNLALVLGLHPESAMNVSGYKDLKLLSQKAGVQFSYFSKINDESSIALLEKADLDILFVVGLSQLLNSEVLKRPKFGVIGYHPTKLPRGRGRSAIGWIVLQKVEAAATLFLMEEGVDSGPIISQRNVSVNDEDYAQDVINKLVAALGECCDSVFPMIKMGQLTVLRQKCEEATYLGVRRPDDGLIDWNFSAVEIARLVRAVSSPLPGAFTIYKRRRLYIWRADAVPQFNYIGVAGRVLHVEPDSFYVGTGEGALKVSQFSCGIDFRPKVGMKLGPCLTEVFLDE